jgi:hypothetical protein
MARRSYGANRVSKTGRAAARPYTRMASRWHVRAAGWPFVIGEFRGANGVVKTGRAVARPYKRMA